MPPFYPLMVKDHNIHHFWIGLVFGISSVVQIFSAMAAGKLLTRFKRQNIIITSMVCFGLGFSFLSTIDYII
jgi:MFS family permease